MHTQLADRITNSNYATGKCYSGLYVMESEQPWHVQSCKCKSHLENDFINRSLIIIESAFIKQEDPQFVSSVKY